MYSENLVGTRRCGGEKVRDGGQIEGAGRATNVDGRACASANRYSGSANITNGNGITTHLTNGNRGSAASATDIDGITGALPETDGATCRRATKGQRTSADWVNPSQVVGGSCRVVVAQH